MNTEVQAVEQSIEEQIAKLEQSIQIKNTLVLIETNEKLKQSLIASITATQADIAKLKAQKFKPAKLAEIVSIMKEFSITLADVKEAFTGTKVAKVKPVPQFINKNNPTEKWSGSDRGVKPEWVKQIQEGLKDKSHSALLKAMEKHKNPDYIAQSETAETANAE